MQAPVGRTVQIRLGWMVGLYLLLLVARWQGWIDVPTWLLWVLGVPVALLVLFVVGLVVLQRVLARRFRRLFQQTVQQMEAWQQQPGGAPDDVVDAEVVEDVEDADGPDRGAMHPDDAPVTIPIDDGDE